MCVAKLHVNCTFVEDQGFLDLLKELLLDMYSIIYSMYVCSSNIIRHDS